MPGVARAERARRIFPKCRSDAVAADVRRIGLMGTAGRSRRRHRPQAEGSPLRRPRPVGGQRSDEVAVRRSRVDKVVTIEEAIARHVRDGMTIAMGTGLVSCILFDQLIGAGCVARVIAAWVGNVGAGIAYSFRRAVEDGVPRPLAVEDHSNFTLALALEAAARGVPYLPSRTALGSDLVRGHPRLREVTCPFTGAR